MKNDNKIITEHENFLREGYDRYMKDMRKYLDGGDTKFATRALDIAHGYNECLTNLIKLTGNKNRELVTAKVPFLAKN